MSGRETSVTSSAHAPLVFVEKFWQVACGLPRGQPLLTPPLLNGCATVRWAGRVLASAEPLTRDHDVAPLDGCGTAAVRQVRSLVGPFTVETARSASRRTVGVVHSRARHKLASREALIKKEN